MRHGVLVAAPLLFASTVHADVRVEQTQIVGVVVISADVTEYTAQLRLKNNGPATSATQIAATVRSKGVVLQDSVVNVGALAARETRLSTDTITWRQSGNGKARFDWDVHSRTPLVLTGYARTGAATPFAGAEVVATVSHTNSGGVAAAWGRPEVEQYTGTATGADGAFTIEVETLAESDFITLQAIGSGGVDVLGSVLGEAGDLLQAADKFSSIVDATRWSRLALTPLSTAAWGAGLQAHLDIIRAPGELDSEAEWAAARLRGDDAGLLQRAVTIKMLIDHPGWPRNAGFVDTLDIAARDSAAQAAFDVVRKNGAAGYVGALHDLVASFGVPFNAATLAGSTIWSYQSDARTNVVDLGASRFQFNADGTGSVLRVDSMLPMTWEVRPNGRLFLRYADTEPSLLLEDAVQGPDYPCSVSPSGQVETREYSDTEELAQVFSDGGGSELVSTHTTTRVEYPGCPSVNRTRSQDMASAFGTQLAVTTLPSQPFTVAEVADRTIASYVFMNGVAGSAAGFGRDGMFASYLVFNANGTGHAVRGSLSFTWQIELTSGDLIVSYENGYVNTIHRLHPPVNGIHQTLVSSVGPGFTMLARNQLIEPDGALIVPGTAGLRLRLGLIEEQALLNAPVANQLQLEWIAASGGTGCRVQVQDTGTQYIRATWTSPPGRIDFVYSAFSLRFYEPIRHVPKRTLDNISTGGYVAFENLGFVDEPAYDPNTEPGRFQFMRELGPATPCSN